MRYPAALLLQADMTQVHFRAESFDAIVALYSVIHVPRERHASLFREIAGWLRPGGWLLTCLGTSDEAGTIDPDCLGAPMYWSGYEAAAN